MKYLIVLLSVISCGAPQQHAESSAATAQGDVAATPAMPSDSIVPPQFDASGKLVKIVKSDAEWKKQLAEQEFYVMRQEGTERAFSGDLWNNHEKGLFICAACGLPLFASETKFDSGTGWPSYYQPLKPEYVQENRDNSYGMTRTEVECARCGAHLGHVFDDGPKPTGLRYCINSVSLDFVKQ